MMFIQRCSKVLVLSLPYLLIATSGIHAGRMDKFKPSLARVIRTKSNHGGAKSSFHTKTVPAAIQRALTTKNVLKGINGNGESSSPLHEAVKANCPFCIQQILNADGVNITQKDPTEADASPLQVAIRYGCLDAALTLLHAKGKELAKLLAATDNVGRTFFHEFARLPRHKTNIADKALKIKACQKNVKNSYDDSDVEIMRNRVKILKTLILLEPDIVNVTYLSEIAVPHKALKDDEFNDPTKEPYIENREEGESVLPITLEYLLRRTQAVIVNDSEKEKHSGKKYLTENTRQIVNAFRAMTKMVANPASVQKKESQRNESVRQSVALSVESTMPANLSQEDLDRIGRNLTQSQKGEEIQHANPLLMENFSLTRQDLMVYHLADVNRSFLMNYYRQQVTTRKCHEFYDSVLRQLSTNKTDARMALSGNWKVRIDNSGRFFKTLLKWIPFVGSGASATAELIAEEKKLKELIETNRAFLEIAATDAIFDQVMEQVLLRIIARYPDAFTPNARYEALPDIFKLEINDRTLREIEKTDRENLVLLRISKVLYNLRDELKKNVVPQVKVEIILASLLGDDYEPLDTTALETDSEDVSRSAFTTSATETFYALEDAHHASTLHGASPSIRTLTEDEYEALENGWEDPTVKMHTSSDETREYSPDGSPTETQRGEAPSTSPVKLSLPDVLPPPPPADFNVDDTVASLPIDDSLLPPPPPAVLLEQDQDRRQSVGTPVTPPKNPKHVRNREYRTQSVHIEMTPEQLEQYQLFLQFQQMQAAQSFGQNDLPRVVHKQVGYSSPAPAPSSRPAIKD